jgi:hypothetical protein
MSMEPGFKPGIELPRLSSRGAHGGIWFFVAEGLYLVIINPDGMNSVSKSWPMNHHYLQVIACLLLSFSGYRTSIAQSSTPEFIDCSSTPDSLCVQDEGVRLPSNNQLYLGEEHPDATRCSVHVTQKKRVRSSCGDTLQYEVQLFIHDTSSAYILKSLTTVVADSLGEAELTFNTEEAVDEYIRTSGIPYSTGCLPYHRIEWIVTDSCGSISTCEQRIELYDCSAVAAIVPTAPSFAIIPLGCQLTLYAKDYYIGGLDDCSHSDQFDFSFEESRYTPDTIYYCPPAYGVEIPWKIWIADAGLDQNCNGQIEWTERNKVELPFTIIFIDNVGVCCEPDFDSTLTGKITTIHADEGINEVYVSLLRPGGFFPTYVTGPDGRYSFEVQLTGVETTIKPEKNDKHKNGVTTLDLVRIQKHLLGRAFFNSPHQYIAADANNSQHVSAIDLLELRKLILGIYTELPNNQSWRFVVKEYGFMDTLDTWTYASTITFTDTLPAHADFYGIKIGDVNGTVQPNASHLLPRASRPQIGLLTDQQSYQAGGILDIPIRISADQLLTGFQLTMAAFGMEIIRILPGSVDIKDEDYALFGSRCTMSWFDEHAIEAAADDVLFTIQARATAAGRLSQSLSFNSEITEAELYGTNDEIFQPVLAIQHEAETQLELLSCFPNPWKDHTLIQFYLPDSDLVTVALFDATGRRIQIASELLLKGYHQHEISSSDFPDRGLLFVEISTPESRVFQKMIVLE